MDPNLMAQSYGVGGFRSGNCCCSFPTLVILILIILQFSRQEKVRIDLDDEGSRRHHEKGFIADNGILFIIALFFLACTGCGKGCVGGY